MKISAPYLIFSVCLYIGSHELVNARKHFSARRRTSFCMKASSRTLARKLKDLGGFNNQITAVDAKSARKNWRQMVAKIVPRRRFGYSRSKSSDFKGFLNDECKQNINEFMHRGMRRSRKEDSIAGLFRRGRRRDAHGQGNCVESGSMTQNGNLNLCKKCMVSTALPEDRFPRYITEVKCSDSWCFKGEGACVERSIQMTFLKRTGNCVLDNNGIYMEEWKPYQQNVRVGCECEIRRASYFARFV